MNCPGANPQTDAAQAAFDQIVSMATRTHTLECTFPEFCMFVATTINDLIEPETVQEKTSTIERGGTG
jgi:hypothetical protein